MNLRSKAQAAPYNLATAMGESDLDRFWVVLLSNGTEVFQTAENPTLSEPNSWVRLKQFCADYNLHIINMAVANRDLDPRSQINLDPTADGFFYSRRIRRLMCANPYKSGYNDEAQGYGYLRGDDLMIYWELTDGRIEVENSKLSERSKGNHNPIGLIRR